MVKLIPFIALAGLALWSTPGAGQDKKFLGKPAAEWARELGQADAKARRNAAFALGKLGGQAAAALPALKQRLQDEKDASVREAVAFAMGEIAKESLAAQGDDGLVSILQGVLKNDPAPLVQRSAAYALGCLGKSAEPARAALEAAMGHENAAVRQNAAWALGRLENEMSIAAIRKGLVDPDPLVRRDSAAALSPFKAEALKPALADLVQSCEVKDTEVRKAALLILSRIIDVKDKTAAAGIRPMLSDADPEVRFNAALVLAKIGGDEAKEAIKPMLEALKSRDPELRQRAAIALGNIGEPALATAAELIKTLADADEKTRGFAALALGRMKASVAIPQLVAVVGNKKETAPVRVEAATALAKIGSTKEAEDGVRTLVAVLEDSADQFTVRERVIWALRVHEQKLQGKGEIPNTVLPAFDKVLGERRQPGVRMLYYDCAYMLGVFKRAKVSEPTLDTLLDFLREKENAILIYVGKEATPGALGKESRPAELKVQETGMGDGRIMAVQALARVASDQGGMDRVAKRADIVGELRKIAANKKLWPRLQQEAEKLVRELGK